MDSASAPEYELRWPGKTPYRPPEKAPTLHLTDVLPGDGAAGSNRLILGDNRAVMEGLLPELRGGIDLVYIDPPFDAGQDFTMQIPLGEDRGMGAGRGAEVQALAYRDIWGEGAESYLQMLYERLVLIRELLSETGSLIVHVNWRVAHLAQLLLDEIFGPGERRGAGRPGFRREIIWGYGGGGSVRNGYRRKHDNLFWYTRSDRWTFNPQYRPYTDKTRRRGLTAVKGPRYTLRAEGASLETWWTGAEVQKILSPTAVENLKFPTQKPESLLERILLTHSNPGDLVADFFCGSGTTGAVAERLGRRWLLVDQSFQGVHLSWKRLAACRDERGIRGAGEWENGGVEEGSSTPPLLHSPTPPDGTGIAPIALYRTACETPEAGVLEIEPFRRADGSLDLRLAGFRPRLPEGVPPGVRERAERAPLDLIDYWAADFSDGDRPQDCDTNPFCHEWRSFRMPASRKLALESEAGHRCARRGPHLAAVKVVDVFGQEAVMALRIEG